MSRVLTVSQRRGRQHQRRLNYDSTQEDAVPNISWNLRKKRSNQYWLEQPTTPQETTAQLKPHKPDLQQIPDNLKVEKARKNTSRRWVFFWWWWEAPHTRKVNEIHRWWRLIVKIWGENKKLLKSYNVQKYVKNKDNFDAEIVNLESTNF